MDDRHHVDGERTRHSDWANADGELKGMERGNGNIDNTMHPAQHNGYLGAVEAEEEVESLDHKPYISIYMLNPNSLNIKLCSIHPTPSLVYSIRLSTYP